MNRQLRIVLLSLLISLFPIITHAQTAPGGISTNLNLWLKADAGVTESSGDVSAWADQSSASYDFSDAGTSPYTYVADGLNYNPFIENVDGSDRRLQNAGTIDLQTVFLVTVPASPDDCDNPFSEVGADDEGIRACTSGANWAVPGAAEDFGNVTGQGWFNGTSATDPAHGDAPNIIAVEAAAPATIAGGVELGDTESSRFWHGAIAEVVGYSSTLSSTDREKVESYLAVKYGILLGHDYFASDGTVIRSFGGTYDYRIAAIGRDDAAGLNQKQSMSSEAGALVTIALGAYAADNASNANTFDGDLDFLSWADDDAPTDVTTVISGTAVNYRMDRVWKVKEVNGITTVEVRIPDVYGVSHLIVDDNNGFSSPAETQLTDNGDGTLSASVDFANGDFFSFATFLPGPGGVVADLGLWLKADAGVSETAGDVSAWTDQSVAGYDFVDAGTSPYTYTADGLNFNPIVENVDGTNRRLENATSIDLQTVVVVATPNAPGTCDAVFNEVGADDEGVRVCDGTGANWSIPGGAEDLGNTSGQGWFNGISATNPAHNDAPGIVIVEAPMSATIAGGVELGDAESSRFWHGSIAELIGYNGTLSAGDRQKVESYLALKYGITLLQDYVASDGTSLWTLAGQGAYHNNVAGIGRDDASSLDQRQSLSSILAFGLNAIAPDNASNGTSFGSDKSFLMLGHDGGLLTESDVTFGSNDAKVLNRIWSVLETGTTGNVALQFDVSSATVTGTTASDFWLVVDTDTDPTNGNRSMVQADAFASNVASFTGIDLQSNDFVMLVTENPGDVTLPVELTHFEAFFDHFNIALTWATASETNNAGFEVQRLVGDASWETIAFVEGHGTTTDETRYTYSDDVRTVGGETVQYRLKQVDFDGGFWISEAVEVALPAPQSYNLSNYPNPFNPVANIEYDVPVEGHIRVSVFDAQGRQVAVLVDETQSAGRYRVRFDGSGLASGIYVYRLDAAGKSFSKTMMLLK